MISSALQGPTPAAPLDRRPFRLTVTQWLVGVIAAIGFAFDTYELLMLPLMIRPALMELGGLLPGTAAFTTWFSLLFYVPALSGGIFALLGGYLTDRLGRRRVLTWSILLYAGAAFASGFATSLPMLLACRCLVFIGVCVEFVAAIAWLAETFPDRREREVVLAVTQAFGSVGGLMVAVAGGIAGAWAAHQPAQLFLGIELPAFTLPAIALPSFAQVLGTIGNPHAAWRYLAMSGLIPAIPLLLIRPFLPESPAWKRDRDAGRLKRPNPLELFSPQLRRTTIVTAVMVTCSFGAAFGAIQQMPQIVPGLPDVKAEVAAAVSTRLPESLQTQMKSQWRSEGKSETEVNTLLAGKVRQIASSIELARAASATKAQEFGGLTGRLLLVVIAMTVVSRRRQLRLFLLPGLLVMPLTFAWAGTTSMGYLQLGMFAAGLLTVGQFSFWGNYLPGAYPLHLRGTGESFAANVGGRMIGTGFAALTPWVAYWLPGGTTHPARMAFAAAAVAFGVYLINTVASFWLPEREENLKTTGTSE